MVDVAVSLAAISVLIGLSAFFGGTEVAMVSLSDAQVEQYVTEKRKGAQALKKLKSNPNRMIATILLGNNLVNIGAATLAAELAITLFGSIGIGIATATMTFTILVFGEITPKAYCNIHAPTVALRFASTIAFIGYVLNPAVKIFEGITKGLLKVLKSDFPRASLTASEFEAILEIGVKEKVLEESEKRFIEGVLNFNDLSVRSVMTPRLKMYTLNASTKIVDSLHDLVREGYSRIPITTGSKDQIVGIIHLRDVLKAVSEGKRGLKLKAISRKPVFVSREKVLSELLKEFQGREEHMAIVVDEYGGVEGLVTLEDILEEVFGEIADEKDISPSQMVRLDNNTALVHGETDIRLVNEFLKMNIEKGDDYSTISGLLHDYLQDIPKQGDKVELDDGTILVESVRGNVPVRVKISRKTGRGSGSK